MKYILLLSLISTTTFAKNYLDDNLRKETWNDIEVIWLEDNSLPTYDVAFYFSEGAISDRKGKYGETELMFAGLSFGTRRYSQNAIAESLEFYGAEYGSRVTHEYSTFSVRGLVKDLIPTMKMICHMFDDATYPKKELKKTKRRVSSGFKSMVTNHSQLANHIFRYESLRGSGIEQPTTGSIKSINKITSRDLTKRLGHFNKNVKKRIYLRGPKTISSLKEIVMNDCRWKQSKKTSTAIAKKKQLKNSSIIFVPVPNANQAQIRIGRYINKSEISFENAEMKSFTAKFIGGGFTSRLVQRLRVEKGLTYSAGAYASEQKNYGRSGISTFTKNETVVTTLNEIKKLIDENSQGIPVELFKLNQKSAKGQYLLSLESTSDFLETLLFFDHINRPYRDIYNYSNKVDSYSEVALAKMVKELFDWDRQTVLILGNKKLIKSLRKAGYKVVEKNYKNYL